MNKAGSFAGRAAAACACVLAILAAPAVARGQSLSASPDPIDFGSVVLGNSGSSSSTLTASGGDTSVTDCSISGTDAGDFSVTSCPGNINDTKSDTVNVDFTPGGAGARSATLTVTYNPGSKTVDIGLTGTGKNLTASPTSLGFGSVAVATTSTKTTTLTAVTDDATGVSCSISGSNNFKVATGTCPSSVTVGSPVDVGVDFTPTGTGSRTATLTVNFGPGGQSLTVSLSGTGARVLSANPTTINFGNVPVGNSKDGSTTLTAANADATNISCSISGGNSGDFSVKSCPTSINQDASADATVTFTPSAAGTRSSTLTVSYDPGNKSISVNLTGNGAVPDLSVSPSPIAFGGVRLGESSSEKTVTLKNNGYAQLDITDVSSSNSVFEITSPPSLPAHLAHNQTVTVGITFTPVTNTSYNGTLDISSNDPNDPISVDISGSGLLTEMVAAPTPYDFGDVRVGSTGTEQTFTIENTAEGDFVVEGISIDDSQNFGLTTGSLPVTLAPTETKTFRVQATPQSLGGKSTVVTVTTDIPGGSTTTLDVSANGVAADMSVDPASVDLGSVDVQSTESATQTVTISNTGTASLDIQSIQLETAEGAPYEGDEFWLGDVGTLPRTIPISSSITVDVFSRPLFEGDVTDVRMVIEGDGLNQVTAEIPLTVHGVDRHISVIPGTEIEFPPTYRNPDTPATVDLEVLNTGGADLQLSMVMKSGFGAGSFVASADSLTVPAAEPGELSRQTLQLSFAPTAASGEPFEADLYLVNDDDEVRMLKVHLKGRGILPEMALTPGILDFGQTGAGVTVGMPPSAPPVKLTNSNPDRSFQVREVRVVDENGEPMDDVFHVDFDGPLELGSMDSLDFDVEFSPGAPGVYQGQLQVFVEGDPLPLAFVLLRGEAVETQLRGGGCSAAGGGGGAGVALLLLALCALLRRRRAWALLFALVCLAPAAHADPSRDLDLGTFRPAPAVEPALLVVETPDVASDGDWGLGLIFSETLRPLVVESSSVVGMTDVPIATRTATELLFSYGLSDRYEVGAGLPFLAQSGDQPRFSGIEPADGTALGDLALHGRMKLAEAQPASLGVAATVTLPTATRDAFAGSELPTVHARAIGGLEVGRVEVAANAGFRLRKSAALADIEQGNELTYGAGAAYAVRDNLAAVGEIFGALGLSGNEILGVSPLEASAGVRYRALRQIRVFGGLGRGLLPGIGSPDLRAFVAVSFAPGAAAPEPLVPPEVVDRGDRDGDGLANYVDKCPRMAEDKDGFEDDDGCPDPDNDNDGLADDRDRCPNKAEDRDGHDDEDGCPDGDNDKDGIPDARDQCPDVQEDKDGFEDDDGCDDPDNDQDGIPDVIDQCPNKPETINANADDDGCPDEGETLVMPLSERIEIFEPVKFRGLTDKINPKSEKVLAQVAALMRAERDILHLQVVAHVHPRGSHDQALSDKRAEAVKKWLLNWGVEPERLEAKGYGSRRPLVNGNNRRARKMNDRIEFIILERKVKRTKK